jgi:hypothetical protein
LSSIEAGLRGNRGAKNGSENNGHDKVLGHSYEAAMVLRRFPTMGMRRGMFALVNVACFSSIRMGAVPTEYVHKLVPRQVIRGTSVFMLLCLRIGETAA